MRLTLAILGALIASGCSAPDVQEPSAAAESSDTLRQLLNADNGLQVRTWRVSDKAERIGAALGRYRDSRAIGPQAAADLRRNGLRIVRVRADLLDTLLSELGVAPVEIKAWHGQIHDWRQLQHHPIGVRGTVVAVGDGVRRFEPGQLRLMARCWTVQMEEGPYMNLELLPVYVRPRPYHRLLGERRLPGDVFSSMRMELLLEAGYSYILTGESPQVPWRLEEDDARATPSGEEDQASALGPSAPTPPTVGELLFAGRGEPPMRTMLVFVPMIPPRLQPPPEVATLGATAEDDPPRATAE